MNTSLQAPTDYAKADILVNLSLCHLAESSYGDASTAAQEALDLIPNHHQAVMTMARISQSQVREHER